jgi:hypothetical protein
MDRSVHSEGGQADGSAEQIIRQTPNVPEGLEEPRK